MIQHLLNTTAIWLLCLLAYDLFLRKEIFHTYNRFYLLLTLVLGLLLPLWKWGAGSVVYSTTFREQVMSVAEAKESIVIAGNTATWSWELYIGAVYLTGVLVAMLLLMIDVIKVTRLYRKGVRSKQDNWVVIETAKAHSPFSIFNFLFVNSSGQYTNAQWCILLAHEQEHMNKNHFVDLLLMQLVRILFWFHPLVYFYNKRLMMVHEYEADSAINSPVNEYGQFLVEQALLGSAPVISHSFNRSPIKKRIIMLTRNSTRYTKLKLFIGIPVMLTCILFFTQAGYSQQKKVDGNTIIYKGNKIVLKEGGVDTIQVIDPVTEKSVFMFEKKEPEPISFNGRQVYNMRTVDRKPAMKGIDYQDYLKEKLATAMEKLSDGTYQVHISNMILDEKGKLVYYDFKGISNKRTYSTSGDDVHHEVPDEVNKSVAEAVENAFVDLPINPAQVGGKPVITHLDDFTFKYSTLEIRDHKIR